jgi:cytochrome c oxidase subunit II
MGWLNEIFAGSATGGDQFFRLLLLLGLVGIIGLLLVIDVIIFRFRRRESSQQGSETAGGAGIGALAAGGAFLLVVVIFYSGFKPFLASQVAPAGAVEIAVHADSTQWRYTYANGYTTDQLHLPAGKPVALAITTDSEARRFVIPALNVNSEALAGQVGSAWFRPDQAGYYRHDDLGALVAPFDSSDVELIVVHEPGTFNGWLIAANDPLATMTPLEAGPIFIQRFGCAQCHTINGAPSVGPSFKDAFGRERLFTDGTKISADSTYLVESILSSNARTVQGFEPVMPSFAGQIDERQAASIVTYIKSISDIKEEK